MNSTNGIAADEFGLARAQDDMGRRFASGASAVSWGAILAGAAAAVVMSMILVILGTGLGLSSVSPWSHEGIGATTFGISTILWITITQLAASAMGGYLAGRLRTKWTDAPVDEVYFRDTAHGFLAWAIASLATAVLMTSVVGSLVSGGVQAGAAVVGGATSAVTGAAGVAANADSSKPGSAMGQLDYFVDSLFRKDGSATSAASAGPAGGAGQSTGASATEVARIFMNSIRSGALPPEDVTYVGQMVAQRTGLAQADAEKRVRDAFATVQAKLRDAETAAKNAADKARKASAYGALWLFVSLFIGAFVASFAATIGGRRRDA